MHSTSTVIAVGVLATAALGSSAWAQPAAPARILAVAKDATADEGVELNGAVFLDPRLMRAAETTPGCIPKAKVTPAILRELSAAIAKYAAGKPYLDVAPPDNVLRYCYFGLVLKELSLPPRKSP